MPACTVFYANHGDIMLTVPSDFSIAVHAARGDYVAVADLYLPTSQDVFDRCQNVDGRWSERPFREGEGFLGGETQRRSMAVGDIIVWGAWAACEIVASDGFKPLPTLIARRLRIAENIVAAVKKDRGE